MHVILTTDIQDLGNAGELVSVKSGYGANFLIPCGHAVLATPRNQARLAHEQRQVEAKIAREQAEAKTLADRLSGLSVTLTRLVGDDDKIFGSVTTKDIAEALRDEGAVVDRRQIQLDAPLRTLGVYDVQVRVHRDVMATIKVWVVAD